MNNSTLRLGRYTGMLLTELIIGGGGGITDEIERCSGQVRTTWSHSFAYVLTKFNTKVTNQRSLSSGDNTSGLETKISNDTTQRYQININCRNISVGRRNYNTVVDIRTRDKGGHFNDSTPPHLWAAANDIGFSDFET